MVEVFLKTSGVTKDIHALPKAKNVTALGFKKPLEGRINVTDRRMSVKDLIVNGDEPYQPMKVSLTWLLNYSLVIIYLHRHDL